MVLIEVYRNFNISFCPSDEMFQVWSEHYDNESKKKSFSACKSYIDEYIKTNREFVPFLVQDDRGNIKKIVGIRKDLRFNYVESNKSPQQLGDYDRKYLFKYNQSNDVIFDELKQIDSEIESLRIKRRKVESEIIKEVIDWESIKAQYK